MRMDMNTVKLAAAAESLRQQISAVMQQAMDAGMSKRQVAAAALESGDTRSVDRWLAKHPVEDAYEPVVTAATGPETSQDEISLVRGSEGVNFLRLRSYPLDTGEVVTTSGDGVAVTDRGRPIAGRAKGLQGDDLTVFKALVDRDSPLSKAVSDLVHIDTAAPLD